MESGCKHIVENIMDFIDNELDDETLKTLENHLHVCLVGNLAATSAGPAIFLGYAPLDCRVCAHRRGCTTYCARNVLAGAWYGLDRFA